MPLWPSPTLALNLLDNGALSAHVPTPGLITGGNARGLNAVDLQTARSGASQVASGFFASIGGGLSNSAAAYAAVASGGQDNLLDGIYSWGPGGGFASARGRYGVGVWASGMFSARGDAQAVEGLLRRQTTDATPTRLTADAGTPGTTNIVNLADNSALLARIMVEGRQSTGAGVLAVSQTVLFARGVGAASTVATAGTAETLSVGTVAGWSVVVSVDTTNGGVAVTVTGAAGATINWLARILGADVR